MSGTQTQTWRVWALGPVSTILALGAATVLFLFEPGRYSFYPRCLFYQTTGLLCPGCGSLRALHQLLHGHVVAALHLNAMFVLALPLAGCLLARWAFRARNKESRQFEFHAAWLWVVLGLGLLFGIVRNLPFAQALWLAP